MICEYFWIGEIKNPATHAALGFFELVLRVAHRWQLRRRWLQFHPPTFDTVIRFLPQFRTDGENHSPIIIF